MPRVQWKLCHNYLANTYQCKENRVYISINTSSMSKNTNNISNDKIFPKLKVTRTTSKKSMNVMPRKIMPSCGIGSSTLSMNVNNNGQIMGKKKETVYQPKWERANRLSPHGRRIPPRRPPPTTAMNMKSPRSPNGWSSNQKVPIYKTECSGSISRPIKEPTCDNFKSPLPQRFRAVSKKKEKGGDNGDNNGEHTADVDIDDEQTCDNRNHNKNCEPALSTNESDILEKSDSNDNLPTFLERRRVGSCSLQDSALQPDESLDLRHRALLSFGTDTNNNGASSSRNEENSPYSRRKGHLRPQRRKKSPSLMTRINFKFPSSPLSNRTNKDELVKEDKERVTSSQAQNSANSVDSQKWKRISRNDPDLRRIEEFRDHEGYSVKKKPEKRHDTQYNIRKGRSNRKESLERRQFHPGYGAEGDTRYSSVQRTKRTSSSESQNRRYRADTERSSYSSDQEEREKAKQRLGYRKPLKNVSDLKGNNRNGDESYKQNTNKEPFTPPVAKHMLQTYDKLKFKEKPSPKVAGTLKNTNGTQPRDSNRPKEFVTVNKLPVRKDTDFPIRLVDAPVPAKESAEPRRRRLVIESPAPSVVVQTTFLSREPRGHRSGRRPYRLVSEKGRVFVDDILNKSKESTRVLTLEPEGFTSHPSESLILENGFRVTTKTNRPDRESDDGSVSFSDSDVSYEDMPAVSKLLKGEDVRMVGNKVIIGTPLKKKKNQKSPVYSSKVNRSDTSSTRSSPSSSHSGSGDTHTGNTHLDSPNGSREKPMQSWSWSSYTTSEDSISSNDNESFSSNNSNNNNSNNKLLTLKSPLGKDIQSATNDDFIQVVIQHLIQIKQRITHLLNDINDLKANTNNGSDSNNNSIKRGGFSTDDSDDMTLKEIHSITTENSKQGVEIKTRSVACYNDRCVRHGNSVRVQATERLPFKCTQTGNSFESCTHTVWSETDSESEEESSELECCSMPKSVKSHRSVQFDPNIKCVSSVCERKPRTHETACSSVGTDTCCTQSSSKRVVTSQCGSKSCRVCRKRSFGANVAVLDVGRCVQTQTQPCAQPCCERSDGSEELDVLFLPRSLAEQHSPARRCHQPYKKKRKTTSGPNASCQTSGNEVCHVDEENGVTLTFNRSQEKFHLAFTVNTKKC